MSERRAHPDLGAVIAALTAYIVLVLYTNLLGFWGPFHVSIFSFLGISESLINALPFVGQGALRFSVVFGAAAGIVWFLWEPALTRLVDGCTKRDGDLSHSAITHAFQLLFVGVLGWLILGGHYATRFALLFFLCGAGILIASRLTRRLEAGPRRSGSWLFWLAVCILPASIYIQANTNAVRIIMKCGWVTASKETALAVRGTDQPDRLIFLGYAGEHYLFFEEDKQAVTIFHDKSEIPVTLVPRGIPPTQDCSTPRQALLAKWVNALIDWVQGIR